MEVSRQINVATRIVFPIVDADGDTVTGAAGLDSESTTWADGSNPGAFADLTNEATEIGTTGIYYLILTAAEMNFDYIAVQVKTTTTGAKTQHILINTRFAPIANASGRVDVGLWLGSAPNALVSGRVDASAGAMATGVIAAATFAAGAIDNAAFNVTETLTANPAAGGITATSFAAGAIDAAAIGTGAIDADAIAADAIGSSELAESAAQEIADAILNRDIAGGASGGARIVRDALRLLRNRKAESGGTLTVYQENDTTAAWTATVTRTASTNPITEIDPA